MTDIVLTTLKTKLNEIKKKRDSLFALSQRNHISEIIEIKQGFSDVIKKHGISSKESLFYAKKYGNKEKELFKQAKYVNKNLLKIMDEILQYEQKN
ncbi:MAG TPA: hypothetical protein VMZ91_08240 [Candidatus Paceibacterota bacterium]|nr:hypothetical protein [Candidatus Paceibacterota bacterium]